MRERKILTPDRDVLIGTLDVELSGLGVASYRPMNATQNPGLISVSENSSKSVTELKWSGHLANDVAATYGPDPFATFTATPEALVLSSSTLGTYRVPRSAVKKIGRGGFYPWFYSAVRVHHDIPGYPQKLQFKPLDSKPLEVITELKALGYPSA